MEKLISLFSVISLILSPTHSYAKMPDHFGQAIKTIEKSRSFSELIEKNKSISDKKYAKFILNEARKHKLKELPVISKKSKHHYQIKAKGHTINLEVLSVPEGRYSINKKDVVLDFSESPQKNLDKIFAVLPKKKTSSIWNPIPEAYAVPVFIYPVGIVLAGLTVMVGGLLAGEAYNCSVYEKAYKRCRSGEATYQELSKISLPHYDTHASCSGGKTYYGKELRDCISRLKRNGGDDLPSPNKVDQ